MRIVKFIAVFLVTAILLFGFVIGLNWDSFNTFFDNRTALMEGNEWVSKSTSLKGLSEFMGANPEHASLTSRVITSPDSAISFMGNEPRVMGTVQNFFVLAVYAVEINNGNVNPDNLIVWDDISRFQLTNVEESAHDDAYQTAVEREWITEGAISVNNTLRLLAETGDFAIADYLWWNIDQSKWPELADQLELTQTEMPLPFSGLYLAISTAISKKNISEIIEDHEKADTDQWRKYVVTLSEEFNFNEEKRAVLNTLLNEHRLGNTFTEERDGMMVFPTATSSELTTLLEQLVKNEFINENVSKLVKEWMRWPLDVQRGITADFTDYGAIYDNRMGLMNGINFGTSVYTGDTTVQALFLDQLPIGFWFHASGGLMHQDFMQRMIVDPAMIEQMKSEIRNPLER
jgi:hypothetical protein